MKWSSATNETVTEDTACVVINDDDFECAYQYFPNSAHTWFLLWLLMFQSVYAHVERPAIKVCTAPSTLARACTQPET